MLVREIQRLPGKTLALKPHGLVDLPGLDGNSLQSAIGLTQSAADLRRKAISSTPASSATPAATRFLRPALATRPSDTSVAAIGISGPRGRSASADRSIGRTSS